MKDKYSHRERLELIFAGEKPDRFAASFWRHFFHLENRAKSTADIMIDFQKHFDWDFVKINPRADFHTQPWGLKLEYSTSEFVKHKKSNFPVVDHKDWRKIIPVSLSSKYLDEHLKVVSLIRKGLGPDIPILMTVFTPLSIAGRMVEDRRTLVNHLREYPEFVLPAIKAITETFAAFSTEVRNAGADGLFYATLQWASSELVTWDEYEKFGIPYDLEVIRSTDSNAINLLHVCNSNNYLKELAGIDYHCKMYNWAADDPTNLPLDKAYEILDGKTMVGGVDETGWLRQSSPDEVINQMDKIKRTHDSWRVIIGPGCVVPPETPIDNLKAIRENLHG